MGPEAGLVAFLGYLVEGAGVDNLFDNTHLQ
jgi:hypothetical protein